MKSARRVLWDCKRSPKRIRDFTAEFRNYIRQQMAINIRHRQNDKLRRDLQVRVQSSVTSETFQIWTAKSIDCYCLKPEVGSQLIGSSGGFMQLRNDEGLLIRPSPELLVRPFIAIGTKNLRCLHRLSPRATSCWTIRYWTRRSRRRRQLFGEKARMFS